MAANSHPAAHVRGLAAEDAREALCGGRFARASISVSCCSDAASPLIIDLRWHWPAPSSVEKAGGGHREADGTASASIEAAMDAHTRRSAHGKAITRILRPASCAEVG